MTAHILDRPVWNSLTTIHAPFAEGNGNALRFSSDIGPFASPRDDTEESYKALAEIIPAGGAVVMLQVPQIEVPPELDVLEHGLGVQLVPDDLALDTVKIEGLEPLGEADAPEMLALARLTKPGPFAARTHRLGTFQGVKRDGRLAAMAGERFRQPGYTEISGVCTHPDFQEHGLGRMLSAAIALQILKRGETPYLHAFADNERAIRLYESLGFRVRCHVQAAVLARAAETITDPILAH